jgi:hypothetical protein
MDDAVEEARIALLNNPDAVIDRPVVGDKECTCGRWRDVTQDVCQCGNSGFTLVCADFVTEHLFARSRTTKPLRPPPKAPPVGAEDVPQEIAAASDARAPPAGIVDARPAQVAEIAAALASKASPKPKNFNYDLDTNPPLGEYYGPCRTLHPA